MSNRGPSAYQQRLTARPNRLDKLKVGQMLGLMNHLVEDDLQVLKAGHLPNPHSEHRFPAPSSKLCQI